MKELIKKILREEVQKRFTKSNQSFERLIIKQMETLISETNRVVVPPDENYGNYNEEWCRGGKVIIEAKYFFNSEDSDDNIFYAGDLYVNKEEIDFLSRMLQVRKSFILNVITEWYDEKYATKFGQETGHPEFEIDETHESDDAPKCYQIIDTDNLSRDEMIDYIDTQSLYKASDLEKMSDNLLKLTYRRVYNIHSNK
jgi:3-methyladenine DNA glycosylase AlkC